MTIPTRKALIVLCLPLVFLLVMHFFPESVSWTIHQRFDLNDETNIPTWYSSALLLLVSISSLAIYLWRDKTLKHQKFWLIFSAVYSFLSMDEVAQIHEAIAPHVKWMYIYAPLAAVFLAYCVYHLVKHEDEAARNWIMGGMVVYGLGVLGFETLWYIFKPLPPLLQLIEVVTEEEFEMAGSTIVVIGCLQVLNRLWNPASTALSSQPVTTRVWRDPVPPSDGERLTEPPERGAGFCHSEAANVHQPRWGEALGLLHKHGLP